ncbi:nucleotidyl transferase AbiEii/AbiGii toxin family protein [Candidatus Peregrinibacteria bacterium]|nr:nucleotidyl transferase AbiEii/AbiGii toxin family protein [Candidatus Peregrinibacteria bacterium]
MFIQNLEKNVLLLREKGFHNEIIKNHLKEDLQLFILDFLYCHKKYQHLIFTGGSCLRLCYGLNRLSEDLDFDSEEFVDKKTLVRELEQYFYQKWQYRNLEWSIKGKNQKIYVKFPVLRHLRLANENESDKLYVKIEIEKVRPGAFHTEKTPIIQDNFSFFVKNYDLPTMMSTKIHAFLFRLFFKDVGNKITFKGRDAYDLLWYLQKEIQPNWSYLRKITGIASQKEVLQRIDQKVKKINKRHLLTDIENLFENRRFAEDFAKNFVSLYRRYRKNLISI